LLIAAIK